MSALAWLPALLAGALAVHAAINARLLRRPSDAAFPEPVAVLLPVRDEAARVEPCLRSLLGQRGVPLSILVLDDGSTDGTADVVRAVAGDDPRVRLLTGAPLPPGWLGKPHACQQLADAADPAARVLAFVDADVVLSPSAVAGAAALLRSAGVGLLSPYPRIVVGSWGERLVQPLLQWSWLTFLPLRALERSARPSLAAAGGQFLVVDRSAYLAAGGHAAVRSSVLEDISLARAVKRSGGRIALADGSRVAECRMYSSWDSLVAGYTKSLWASFGSALGAAAVVGLLLLVYVVPVLLTVFGLVTWSLPVVLAGCVAYALGVLGRVASAAATGGRWWPDALAQPVSVLLFGWLVVRSYRLRRAGALRWRDRPVVL
ncbi:Glycosyltransferase, catalytic subunit of cellulose synthase and poly-beta-1,6-N-acetylglucosamine synthase [Asanoa hainanensis]|uniref:Glycosyltransferase, catalytic subunit of cellulose synthase and poly-beta-1,6-N-acetylglucosamine synthase n=1 Tax=Asanoa hainanensis TaxID=560556 RepID=A0A239ND99_9ACTN|nr:glycosyltransferase family A protein [Asanoa hainanensis]SNT52871.1 Glycosyltransferase, catalytic subunit of cellulose synthase and poly-beta-1,6-N-acetylglucosamine synthase [Asanoa hainanensis]